MVAGVRKPDSNDTNDGSPAVGAGRLSSLDFVREIVKRGANVNFRLPSGSPGLGGTSSRIATEGAAGATPFLFAADRADLPLMRVLKELGADPLLPNFNNTTPLMAAAGVGTTSPDEEAGEESEALEAVKMLLDLGADINTVDSNGDTAMHGAAYNAYPLVAKLLAERGADPQIWKKPNKAGGTPLFIAEGYADRTLQPDAPTIEAITKLMLAAGISTEGERPKVVDIYQRVARSAQAFRTEEVSVIPGNSAVLRRIDKVCCHRSLVQPSTMPAPAVRIKTYRCWFVSSRFWYASVQPAMRSMTCG